METSDNLRLVQNKIDDLESISIIQRDFLKLVYWANEKYGMYYYIKSKIEERYTNFKDEFNISEEIDGLVDNEILIRKVKKTIYNGEYKTNIVLKINEANFKILLNG